MGTVHCYKYQRDGSVRTGLFVNSDGDKSSLWESLSRRRMKTVERSSTAEDEERRNGSGKNFARHERRKVCSGRKGENKRREITLPRTKGEDSTQDERWELCRRWKKENLVKNEELAALEIRHPAEAKKYSEEDRSHLQPAPIHELVLHLNTSTSLSSYFVNSCVLPSSQTSNWQDPRSTVRNYFATARPSDRASHGRDPDLFVAPFPGLGLKIPFAETKCPWEDRMEFVKTWK